MKYLRVLISMAIAHAAGLVGSFFTRTGIDSWYAEISKPTWTPPSWVFAPVWLALYTLIGYSAFLIWEERTRNTRVRFALVVYGIHLVLNALWSITFFGMQNPKLAFLEILVLDAFIVWSLVLFWRIRRTAGILLMPYLAWAAFATFLNYTIWMLN